MITTVAVAGYRSLRDLIVPLRPLTVITGPNASGKSNLYRALRLLSAVGRGEVVGALAREGGLPSALWAGAESGRGQGGPRRRPVAVQLGVATDDVGYLVDLGLPHADPEQTLFTRDPEIKREQVFVGEVARPATLLVDRTRAAARIRDGGWTVADQAFAPWESVVTDLADAAVAPELLGLRRTLSGWRFHDHVRVDPESPVRRPQVATRTRRLADDGSDLAAAWQTIVESGGGAALDDEVARAFSGARVSIQADDGIFRLELRQPGLLRPLVAAELSDGTLRYLLLCAALLSPEPGPLVVLNEPESSLHPDLLTPLARLIARASASAQVVVVSHAEPLVVALSDQGAGAVRLVGGGETRVEGQGLLDVPRWNWGTR